MSDPTPSEPRPAPADAYQISEVALTDIRVFKRLRPLEPARVEALAASMEAEGRRHPIAVRRTAEGSYLVGTDWKPHAD
jgi:ParB-like chromosome segregation protein Spo0J